MRLNITVTSIFKRCTALKNYDADSDLLLSERWQVNIYLSSETKVAS